MQQIVSRPNSEEEGSRLQTFFVIATPIMFVIVQLAMAPRGLARPAPSHGRSKILIGHLLPLPNATAPPTIAWPEVEVIEDYDFATLGSVAEEDIEKVKARAAANGVDVAVHDEYDTLGLPGGTIDTRIGVITPPGGEPAAYPTGKYGLYLVQLFGPPKPEWLSEIRSAGAVIVEPIPLNGYLVAMTPQMAAGVRNLRTVQFLDRYHPFLKAAASVDRRSSEPQDVFVQIAEAPGKAETVAEVTAIIGTATERKDYNPSYILRGRLEVQHLQRLLANRLVIGVHKVTTPTPSDERQATALTSNVTIAGSNPRTVTPSPGSEATYASWLASACSYCGNLSNEGFIVGIADTGLDNGPTGSRHTDLLPTARMRYGGVFLNPGTYPCASPYVCEHPTVCNGCDGSYHGTFVAGIVAGNAGTAKRDASASSTGFFLGTGIAPSAGILSTKIFNKDGAMPRLYDPGTGEEDNNIFFSAADATSRSTWIQNHSHNEYNQNPSARGMYTLQSREADIAVRDSNGPTRAGALPITLTVSAGNRHQDPPDQNPETMPPATAKNTCERLGDP